MTALYHLKTLRLFQRTCPRYMNSVAYLSVQPNQAHVLPSSELRSSEKVHGRNPPLQPYKNKRLMMSPIRKQIGRYKQKGIDSEEEELIERHREGLENLNWLTLTDAANSIEWKQKVTPRMLDLVVHLVSNPETNVSNLSDHSVAVIISSAGSLCRSLPPAVRSKKLKKITENLSKRGAKLGVEARNALLNAEIDNGVVVNVVKALEEYSLSDCDPDIQTYTALARAYARRGNVRGIFEIIEYVKQNGMAVNQSLFESLVSSLSLSNEDDKAMNIIQSIPSNVASEFSLRLAFALAKAEKCDIESILKVLEAEKDSPVQPKFYGSSILSLFLTVLRNDRSSQYSKLLPLLDLDSDGKLSNAYDFSLVQSWLHECRISDSPIPPGVPVLLSMIPERYAIAERQQFGQCVLDAFDKGMETNSVVKMAKRFEHAELLKNPLRSLTDHALERGDTRFMDLYDIFLNSDEGKAVCNRYHLQYPAAARNMTRFFKSDDVDERCKIMKDTVTSVLKSSIAPPPLCTDRWIVEPLMKDKKCLEHLFLKKLVSRSALSEITRLIVEYCLRLRKFKELKILLDGPLKESYVQLLHLQKILVTTLTRPSSTEDELLLASRLLSSGYPGNVTNGSSLPTGVKIVYDVLKIVDLARADKLIKSWSDGGKITLSVDVMKQLQKELIESGSKEKAHLLPLIKKKSTTLRRWWNTKDISLLEREAEAIAFAGRPQNQKPLASLYTVIIEKYLAEKPLNLDQLSKFVVKYCNLKLTEEWNPIIMVEDVKRRILREAIRAKNVKVCKIVWELGVERLDLILRLSYAGILFTAGEVKESQTVLDGIKTKADTITSRALFSVLEMIGESAESDKFFELIGRTFNLSESLNNKLTSRRKMKQLVDLISLGKLEEAFYLVKELFSSKSAACGQLELMSAALNVGDTTLLKNVFSLIQNKRGKNDALLDFGLVLLENGKFEQASRVFSADELHITDAKLSLFVSREADTKRLDVLAMLFSNLNKEGKASVNGLNSLLRQLLSLIDSKSTANQTTSFDLLSIIQESIKESGFPVEKSLQLRLAKLFPRKADSGSSSTSVSHKS